MIAQAVGLGMAVCFAFTELVGLSPGGLIVPGYLAFFLDQPSRVAGTFAAALISYGMVILLSNFVILYGRRRFMAAVLLGYVAGWLIETSLIGISPFGDIHVIGYVVPGLIANDMVKQGVLNTMAATLFVSAIVRLLLILFVI